MKITDKYEKQADDLFEQGKIDEALECLFKALKLGSANEPNINNFVSYLLIVKKRYEEAIPYADKAIELDPNHQVAYGNRGIALKFLGKYEEAIVDIDKSLAIDPYNAACLCHKGNALNTLGREEEAMIEFQKAFEVMKNNQHTTLLVKEDEDYIKDTLKVVLEAYESAQDTEKILESIINKNDEKAKEAVEKFIQLQRATAKVVNKITSDMVKDQTKSDDKEKKKKEQLLLLVKENPDQVLTLLEKFPEGYNYPEIIPYLIKVMTDLQKNANIDFSQTQIDLKAIKYSLEHLTTDNNKIKQTMKEACAYKTAGDCENQAYVLFDQGKIDEALECLLKALELGSTDESNINNFVSYLLIVKKRYQEAIPYADKAIALNSNHQVAYGNRGIALKFLGRYEEAIVDIDKSLAKDPHNAACLCHKGNALNTLGREEEAMVEFKKAFEVMKNNKHTTLLVQEDQDYIKDTLKVVLEVYESAINTEKMLGSLVDNDAERAKKAAEKLAQFKKAANKVVNKVTNDMVKEQKIANDDEQKKKEQLLLLVKENPDQVLTLLEKFPEGYNYPEIIPYLVTFINNKSNFSNSVDSDKGK